MAYLARVSFHGFTMKSLCFLCLTALMVFIPACSNEETPGMVGKEALSNLPEGPEIKVSPLSKNIKAEGPAGTGSNELAK